MAQNTAHSGFELPISRFWGANLQTIEPERHSGFFAAPPGRTGGRVATAKPRVNCPSSVVSCLLPSALGGGSWLVDRSSLPLFHGWSRRTPNNVPRSTNHGQRATDHGQFAPLGLKNSSPITVALLFGKVKQKMGGGRRSGWQTIRSEPYFRPYGAACDALDACELQTRDAGQVADCEVPRSIGHCCRGVYPVIKHTGAESRVQGLDPRWHGGMEVGGN